MATIKSQDVIGVVNRNFYTDSSTTIDLGIYDLVVVNNGVTNVTITVDANSYLNDRNLTVSRYDATSTGNITVVWSNGVNLIQTASNALLTSFVWNIFNGIKPITWFCNGGHLFFEVGDSSNVVQGETQFGRSIGSSSKIDGTPSGFATVTDTTLPSAGNWSFHRIRTKANNSVNSAINWLSDILVHAKTGAMYESFYDADTLTYQVEKRIHTNRWFDVNEAMIPTATQTLNYNGTQWINQERIITGSSTVAGTASNLVVTVVAHGLGVIPSWFQITPTNSASSASLWFVSADTTNLYISYATQPSTTVNSLAYKWAVRK